MEEKQIKQIYVIQCIDSTITLHMIQDMKPLYKITQYIIFRFVSKIVYRLTTIFTVHHTTHELNNWITDRQTFFARGGIDEHCRSTALPVQWDSVDNWNAHGYTRKSLPRATGLCIALLLLPPPQKKEQSHLFCCWWSGCIVWWGVVLVRCRWETWLGTSRIGAGSDLIVV